MLCTTLLSHTSTVFLNARSHLDLSDGKKFFINHRSVVNVSNMNEDFVQYVFSVVFCILVA